MSNFWQAPNWGSVMSSWAGLGFILLMIWSLVWKGIALWKAARLGQKYWFIALLVVNTLAILEIIYIFVISRKKEKTAMPTQI